MMQKTHKVMMTLTFDKPVSASKAAEFARDNIHGDFYPNKLDDEDPGKFRVKTIQRMPTSLGRRA